MLEFFEQGDDLYSRFTLGKPPRKSPIESPASKWLNKLWMGTRVPTKTTVPARIFGSEW